LLAHTELYIEGFCFFICNGLSHTYSLKPFPRFQVLFYSPSQHPAAQLHKMYGAFLIDPAFWSRIGFLISYIATFFLVLEVLRLIYTDVNKREVEKFLESYSKQRNGSPRRQQELRKIPIDELERPVTPPNAIRPTRAAVTPESEKTLVHERRRRAQSSASQTAPIVPSQRTSSPTSVRKLRKRSDTLNSTGSTETRRPLRRHREASPASEAGSKTSSRHGSPRPRSKEEKKSAMGVGLGLGKLMRAKV
jgi:hypothetical protein